jgi:hypothetical protein
MAIKFVFVLLLAAAIVQVRRLRSVAAIRSHRHEPPDGIYNQHCMLSLSATPAVQSPAAQHPSNTGSCFVQ